MPDYYGVMEKLVGREDTLVRCLLEKYKADELMIWLNKNTTREFYVEELTLTSSSPVYPIGEEVPLP